MVLLDLDTHLEDSTAVVEVVVGAHRTSFDASTLRPVTDTRVTVVEHVWGHAPSTFDVRQLKGKVGDVELLFPGSGELTEGARLLLFLVEAEGHWWLTALAQSVYEVSGVGPDAMAVRQLDELNLFIRDPDLGVIPVGKLESPPTRLADLKARIVATGKGK